VSFVVAAMSLSQEIKELRNNVLSMLKITQRPIDQQSPAELQAVVDALNKSIYAIGVIARGALLPIHFAWSLLVQASTRTSPRFVLFLAKFPLFPSNNLLFLVPESQQLGITTNALINTSLAYVANKRTGASTTVEKAEVFLSSSLSSSSSN